MSTSAHIGYIQTNGKVVVVHCYYDGYPSHVGSVLLKKYKSLRDVKILLSDGGMNGIGDDGIPDSRMDNDFVADEIPLKSYLDGRDLRSADYVYLWSDIENIWLFMPTFVTRTGRVPAENYKELYTLDDDVIRNRPPRTNKSEILAIGVEVIANGYNGIIIANEVTSNYGHVPKGMVLVRLRSGDTTISASEVTLK